MSPKLGTMKTTAATRQSKDRDLKKAFLAKVKAILLAEKTELLQQTGMETEVDTEGDETDEIQGAMLAQMLNQLNTRHSARLSQIESALQRLADGTYGKCQDCEEMIPEKRLLANPHFQICVMCAEERETERKRKGV